MRTTSLARSVVVVSLVILGRLPGLAQAPPGGSGPPRAQPAPTSFLAPARATRESTRTLVLGLIEAMPEDKYDFKPTPTVRSFREVVVHLVGENYLFFGRVAGERPRQSRAEPQDARGAAEGAPRELRVWRKSVGGSD